MEERTLAETIKEVSRKHLEENGGLLIGQCITALGWVNGTVPNVQGIVELPMTDVAGAGIAVGAAMMGRRPIFVVRFQDFMMLNSSPFVNYAAKVKELHGKTAPVFIRALASEGMGPVHSGVLHSVFMHFPGFIICSPMTPGEYEEAWEVFMENDRPMFVSEHRSSFQNTEELEDKVHKKADITLYGISYPRFALEETAKMLAEDGIVCNIVHIMWLKPFEITDRLLEPLKRTNLGLVIDNSFEICGAARSIAYELSDASGYPVKALGLLDKTKCLCKPYRNEAPDSKLIFETVKKIIRDC